MVKIKGSNWTSDMPFACFLTGNNKTKKKDFHFKVNFCCMVPNLGKKSILFKCFYCTFFLYFKCTYYWYGVHHMWKRGGGAYTRYLFIYFLYNRNIILPSFAFHCSVWQSQLIFGKFKTKMESLLVLTRLEMLDILQHRYTCSVISP